jgi:ribosomal protein S27E
MPEGYCVKCKAKKEIAEAVEEVMKNGRKAIKGRCPTCGVVMFKILGGKAVVAPHAPAVPDPAAGTPQPTPSTAPALSTPAPAPVLPETPGADPASMSAPAQKTNPNS